MTDGSKESKLTRELDRLLVSAVLGDADDEERERLNDLLAGDIELRRQASRFLEEEAVLCQQFQVLARVSDYHTPPAEWDNLRSTPAGTALATAKSGSLGRLAVIVFAASLLAALTAWTLWLDRSRGGGVIPDVADPAEPRGDLRPVQAGVLSNVARLPRVLNITWAGPQFASELDSRFAPVRMPEGVIPFTSLFGQPAEGYMIHLSPGAILEIVVTAEANAENALAVIEFDGAGQPTGQRTSFSNRTAESSGIASHDDRIPAQIRFGPLGVFREQNDSSVSRYYLLTCVHKLVDQSADDSWHVSQLSVPLADDDFVHVGWDDSGIMPTTGGTSVPDEDFNDLSATIRIHGRVSAAASKPAQLRVLAGEATTNGVLDVPITSDDDAGVPFTVAPGEVVVLKMSNRAWVPISLAVIDEETGKLEWRCSHREPRFTNIGICALENGSPRPRAFRLVCHFLPPDAPFPAGWRTSNHEVLFQQDAFMTVGFENGSLDGSTEHVKVDMITMERL